MKPVSVSVYSTSSFIHIAKLRGASPLGSPASVAVSVSLLLAKRQAPPRAPSATQLPPWKVAVRPWPLASVTMPPSSVSNV